jgi:hypothetical protein
MGDQEFNDQLKLEHPADSNVGHPSYQQCGRGRLGLRGRGCGGGGGGREGSRKSCLFLFSIFALV